jgi:geranylgeranyl pyrophosphate synthase
MVTHLFNRVYQFINDELLALWDWPECEAILANRQQIRSCNASAWVDVLPSLACAACGGDSERSIPLSAAWSLYMLAGRIVDDIHDDEGKEHLWNADGLKQSLPTALFVMGLAHTALARLKPPDQVNSDIFDAYGRVLSAAARAQRERHYLSLDSLSVESYFNSLVSRTAVAFATAAWSGSKLASACPEVLEALYQYGLAVGIAIQIEDDCADIVRSDLLAGIYTLPVIYGLSQTEHRSHSDLVAQLSTPNKLSTSQVDNIAAILTHMNAFAWTRQMAGIYRVKAAETLAALPSEFDTGYLRDFALGNCQICEQ